MTRRGFRFFLGPAEPARRHPLGMRSQVFEILLLSADQPSDEVKDWRKHAYGIAISL